ncbi:MAG: hypothetical protein M1480_14975 [Bacteroidetes bacterium]|nr:hypothetical protein [Bacteroidota bacterium]
MEENIYDQLHVDLINSLQQLKQINAPDNFEHNVLLKLNSSSINKGINFKYGYSWSKLIPILAAAIIMVVAIIFLLNEQVKSDNPSLTNSKPIDHSSVNSTSKNKIDETVKTQTSSDNNISAPSSDQNNISNKETKAGLNNKKAELSKAIKKEMDSVSKK